MLFTPISIDAYVEKHLRSNPDEDAAGLKARLFEALESYKAGRTCDCGAPIWVIGSAVASYMCFTCLTGEAVPDDDYEIDEACR